MALLPDYPVVQGEYQISNEWRISLEEKYNRRLEEGSIVIWRTGLTYWAVIYGKEDMMANDFLISIKTTQSKDAKNITEKKDRSVVRYRYELEEEDKNRTPSKYVAIYSYTIRDGSYVQCAAYCDTDADKEIAIKTLDHIHSVDK